MDSQQTESRFLKSTNGSRDGTSWPGQSVETMNITTLKPVPETVTEFLIKPETTPEVLTIELSNTDSSFPEIVSIDDQVPLGVESRSDEIEQTTVNLVNMNLATSESMVEIATSSGRFLIIKL